MTQTNSDLVNFQNIFIKEIQSTIQDQIELVNWEQVSSFQQKSIQKAILSEYSPYYLVFPHHKSCLSQLVKLAHQNNWSILPTGNSTKISWAGLSKNIDLVISTSKLNQVIEYAEEDLVITVESGMKLKDLQAIVAENNQFLPIDANYDDSATIGGIIATADTGSWRQRYGGVRDLILGLSFVRFDGEIAKAGGKVVKNVAGYDLMKLFTGSYGTLGIITEITLRLYPLPENSSTLIVNGNPDNLAQLRQIIVSSGLTPTCADVVSASLMQNLQLGETMSLIIRFQSIQASVNNQVEQIKSLAEKLNLNCNLYTDNDEETLWHNIKNIFNNIHSEDKILCKVGILPVQSINFCKLFNSSSLINISMGLGIVSLSEAEISVETLLKMRKYCEANQGFLTILESPVLMKKQIEPWGYNGNSVSVMQKIKAQFDPKNMFKPQSFINS